jgi:hypothetical protein
MDWGYKGAGRAAMEGAGFSAGFWRGPTGRMQFLGGAEKMPMLKGAGIGLGVGALAYHFTDNWLIGAAAGFGGTAMALRKSAGGLKAGGGMAMRLLGPAFTLAAMHEGYQYGGVGGAVTAGVRTAAEFAMWDVGIKAATTAFKGTAVGRFFGTATRLAIPAAIALAAGYGVYKGATALAKYGRRAVRSEFVGSMDAFDTRAGYTMRQRALQEIGRSHTNARTVLGNEATLMHL